MPSIDISAIKTSRIRIIVIALLLALSSGVRADTGGSQGFPESFAPLPAESLPPAAGSSGAPVFDAAGAYRRCSSSSECVGFSAPCEAPIAVNRAYLSELQSWYDFTSSHVSCSLSGSPAPALCVRGACTLFP